MTADYSISIARILPSWSSLDQSEIDLLATLFKPDCLKQDEIFIKAGKPINRIAFLLEGFLYQHDLEESGNIKVEKFICDNHFFTDREGYTEGTHSKSTIQALAPCSLLVISISDFKMLKDDYPRIDALIDKIALKNFNEQICLSNYLLTGCLRQRIERFNKMFARWEPLISEKIKASYLNISESSISHIHK